MAEWHGVLDYVSAPELRRDDWVGAGVELMLKPARRGDMTFGPRSSGCTPSGPMPSPARSEKGIIIGWGPEADCIRTRKPGGFDQVCLRSHRADVHGAALDNRW